MKTGRWTKSKGGGGKKWGETHLDSLLLLDVIFASEEMKKERPCSLL